MTMALKTLFLYRMCANFKQLLFHSNSLMLIAYALFSLLNTTDYAPHIRHQILKKISCVFLSRLWLNMHKHCPAKWSTPLHPNIVTMAQDI